MQKLNFHIFNFVNSFFVCKLTNKLYFYHQKAHKKQLAHSDYIQSNINQLYSNPSETTHQTGYKVPDLHHDAMYMAHKVSIFRLEKFQKKRPNTQTTFHSFSGSNKPISCWLHSKFLGKTADETNLNAKYTYLISAPEVCSANYIIMCDNFLYENVFF